MSDPYEEATRHDRRRLPTFAKVILVGGGLFAAVLVTLVVVGMMYGRKMAEDFMERDDFALEEMDFEASPAETFANLAESMLGEDLEFVEAGEDGRLLTLRLANQDEAIHVDFSELGEWLEGGLESAVEDVVESAVAEGIRIDGRADEEGGFLRIRNNNGRTVLEIRGDGQGGVVSIRGPRERIRLRAGEEAGRMPRWVPVPPGASVEFVFSGDSRGVSMGGAVLKTDASPREAYEWYVDNLPGAGFGISKSKTHFDDRRERGMIQAEREGLGPDRKLSVMMSRDREGKGFVVLMHKTQR